MFTTVIISFREFFEAFLIIGVFLGISRKMKLGREIEIGIAAICGFVISFLISALTYVFGSIASGILTQERAELLESYLLIFAGCFIAYVVFSLHNVLRRGRSGKLLQAHSKLSGNTFDLSLFLTIVTLVVREGFEIALFTAGTSLFSVFLQNIVGLLSGFIIASILGALTFMSFLKLPLDKIFKATEYLIILLGASLAQNGITRLLEHAFGIRIGDIFRLPLSFLPGEESIAGHLLQSFLGIDSEFSLIRLGIMGLYFLIVYSLFLKKRKSSD